MAKPFFRLFSTRPLSASPETRGVALSAGAGFLAAGLVWGHLPASAFKARALVGLVPNVDAIAPSISADQFSPPVLRRIGERLESKASAGLWDASLARAVSAAPGVDAGTLQVFATAPSAARAVSIAAAAADAIVANQDEMAHRAKMQREARETSALAQLQAQSVAAHRRLAGLGVAGMDDPDEMLVAAKVRATNARARVATIRAIMAAGSPPLSDRADVPAGLKTLQFNYLDLMQQLARARETFGDRHSTIVALTAQVKKASAKLTAEWQRLGQAAENEVAVSRGRLDALTASIKPTDPAQAAAIATARREVRKADDELARGQRPQRGISEDEATYRVVTPAGASTTAQGVSLVFRILLSGVAGLLVWAGGLRLRRWWGLPGEASILSESQKPAAIVANEVQLGPWDAVSPTNEPAPIAAIKPLATAAADVSDDRSPALLADPSVDEAADRLPLTTIMVAANELQAHTTPVALAIGRAAASEGVRVLIVETPRPVPTLASATESIDPVIVDLYGMLRIALPADEAGLYLAPSLIGGERIAAELTRRGETPMIDDIAAKFDLIVIDGGCAAESAEAWRADVYLRVGPSTSRMADALFAATFDIPMSALLDTVVLEDPEPVPAIEPMMPKARFEGPPMAPVIVPLPPHLQPTHLVTRRQAGARHASHGRR